MTTSEESAALLQRVRDEAPLVQCITNVVVANVTANVLLAVGAAPAMVDIIGEAGPFARLASGLLVNTGTPRIEQREAAREAVASAVQAGTPWVLDPVAIGSLPIRTALARDLSIQGPSAVRGNPSEVIALAGLGSGGRGVDSSDAPDAAAPAARDLARRLGTVVAASGSHDFITDGMTTVDVANGHPLLTRMTGGGCALGALVAAFLAARGEHSALAAVTAAHVVHGLSAERAAMTAEGPGSFAVALLDQLAELTPDDVAAGARITQLDVDAR